MNFRTCGCPKMSTKQVHDSRDFRVMSRFCLSYFCATCWSMRSGTSSQMRTRDSGCGLRGMVYIRLFAMYIPREIVLYGRRYTHKQMHSPLAPRRKHLQECSTTLTPINLCAMVLGRLVFDTSNVLNTADFPYMCLYLLHDNIVRITPREQHTPNG